METFSHLFFECRVTSSIWSCVLQWQGHSTQIMSLDDEVQWMSQISKKRGGLAEITSCAFELFVTMLWQA